MKHVRLRDIDVATLSRLLCFMYTGSLDEAEPFVKNPVGSWYRRLRETRRSDTDVGASYTIYNCDGKLMMYSAEDAWYKRELKGAGPLQWDAHEGYDLPPIKLQLKFGN